MVGRGTWSVKIGILGSADGVVMAGGRMLVELEDVAQHYRRPSIIDIKVRSCTSSGYMTGSNCTRFQLMCASVGQEEKSVSQVGSHGKCPRIFFVGEECSRI